MKHNELETMTGILGGGYLVEAGQANEFTDKGKIHIMLIRG